VKFMISNITIRILMNAYYDSKVWERDFCLVKILLPAMVLVLRGLGNTH